MIEVVVPLLGYIIIRELFYIYQTNKLLNKLMSRNYHDFMFSENVSKTMDPKGQAPLKEDVELSEDLAPIHGFGMN